MHQTYRPVLLEDARTLRLVAWLLPAVLLLTLAIAGPLALHHVLVWGLPVWEENGPMEDVELLFLMLGTVALVREATRRSALSPALGIVAFVYLALCLRELDLHGTAAPLWLVSLLGKGRILWLTGLGGLVVGNAWPQRHRLLRALRREDWRSSAWLFVELLFLFGLSLLATRHALFHVHATREFLEESCEVPLEIGLYLLALILVGKSKSHRANERGETDGLTFELIREIARQAVSWR